MCVSVPLPNNNVPKTGMKVEQIYAFSCNDIIKVKKTEDKREFINKGNKYFQYTIRGRILDTHKAIIQVLGFTISLEYDYPKGFNSDFMHNDYVEFDVDRLDCLLSN
jgi:hypothetical protein